MTSINANLGNLGRSPVEKFKKEAKNTTPISHYFWKCDLTDLKATCHYKQVCWIFYRSNRENNGILVALGKICSDSVIHAFNISHFSDNIND